MKENFVTAALPQGAPVDAALLQNEAMFKYSYGLFVLTAREGEKDLLWGEISRTDQSAGEPG